MDLACARARGWPAVPAALLVIVLAALLGGCGAPPAKRPPDPAYTGPFPTYPTRDAFVAGRRFWSSFESPDDFAGFYWVPAPHLGTTSQGQSRDTVHSGTFSYHATITGTNPVRAGENTNHRAYPTVQLFKTTDGPFQDRVRIEFWAWLDADLSGGRNADWFSFATLSSYADEGWYQSQLLNLNSDGYLRLQHVPTAGRSVVDIYQSDTVRFPMRRWVKLTILVDYTSANQWGSAYLAAWQDEQLVSAARFNGRADPTKVERGQWPSCLDGWDGKSIKDAELRCRLDYRPSSLAQAHFGLYAPPLLGAGQLFEDDLEIVGSRSVTT